MSAALGLSDAELEAQIEAAYQEALAALAPTEQREAFKRMGSLIQQRSPGRVAEMERERRLRAP